MDAGKASLRSTVDLVLRYDLQFQPPYSEEQTVGKQGNIDTDVVDSRRGIYACSVCCRRAPKAGLRTVHSRT